MPQQNRSSGSGPSPAPSREPVPAADRAPASGGEAAPSSLAYNQRPDFYGPGPAKRLANKAVLACALLAVLGAVGFGLGSRSHVAQGPREPASQVAATDPRLIVSLVRDAQEEDRIRAALKAHEPVPQLAQASPEVKAQVASGERRVAFLRVVQIGERGDRLAVRVNGEIAGELDMNTVGSSVAVVYSPGSPIELSETVTGTSGAPGVHQFDAPDGQTFVMVKSVGNHVDWKGKIE